MISNPVFRLFTVTGTQMGRIEWDVKDCMQSSRDYIIAVVKKKKEKRVARKIAQEVRQGTRGFAELHGEAF